MAKKFIIPLSILILLLIAVGGVRWLGSGKEKGGSSTESPEGTEYATPETGVIEGVVKPAPFNPEDVIVDPETGTKIIKDEIIILFKDGVSEEERNNVVSSINGETVGYGLSGQEKEVKINGNPSISELKKIVGDLNKNPKVEDAILSRVGTIFPKKVPDIGKDPQWKDSWDEENPKGKNWGLEAIYAPSAWNYSDSIKPIKIGIVDTGFKINHEDLNIPGSDTNLNNLEGVDEINSRIASLGSNKECVMDKWGAENHGTHIAGIIGALSNNEVGITGATWDRELLIYQVDLKEINLLKGVEWLLNRETKIINLSWGWDHKCDSEEEIENGQKYYNDRLKKMMKKYNDFLIIQAAGNSGIEAGREALFNPSLNGAEDEEFKKTVITVGAIENKGKGKYQLANFSNFGDLVDIVAPGKDIYSTLRKDKIESPFQFIDSFLNPCFDWSGSYGCMDGTSMSAPFVAGIAGLIWGANPDLTAEQVKEAIVNSADRPITYKEREYKILNAKKSVEFALGEGKKFVEGEKTEEEPSIDKEEKSKAPEQLEQKPRGDEEKETEEKTEALKKGGIATLISKPEEEKEEETAKIEEDISEITSFVKDQHNEAVPEAKFWLVDEKGNEYATGSTSQAGYLEIDTDSLLEGDYVLHIEKETWDGLIKIPYCDPYEKKISITKNDISLGTITIHKWSKITAKLVDETGALLPDNSGLNAFAVIDKDGTYSDSGHTYPNPPYHWRYQNEDGWIESYPLPDGEYMLRIRIYWVMPWSPTIVERKVNIAGNDVFLGDIIIPKE